MNSDINSLTCRVCLKIESSSIPMRKLNNNRELFLECTSLLITPEEPYPQQLCFKCWQKFIAWKEFKLQAIKADRELKSKVLSPAVVKKEKAENEDGEGKSSGHKNINKLSNVKMRETCTSRKTDPLTSSESSSSPEEEEDDEESEEESSEDSIKPENKRPRPNPTKTPSSSTRTPVQCPICNKFFNGNRDLVRHSIIHTGAKPWKCDRCDRAFARKDNLDSHIRTHTREKPYQCDICFNYFAHKSSLNTHKYRHDEDRPFKCDLCDKSFFRNYHLSLHMDKHKEEKEKT